MQNPPGDTTCARSVYTFTNTSSCHYMHRMFNLNAFYVKWNLYSGFINQPLAGGFSADSAITWKFEYLDNSNPPQDPRIFLPYATPTGTIWSATDLPGCFTANEFRARLRPMTVLGRLPQIIANGEFSLCTKYCNDDMVGINSYTYYDNLNIYPNPAVNGKTSISGLKGKNTIMVYDVLGQLILVKTSEENKEVIDLTKQPKGTYILRVVNTDKRSKVVKIFNQN